MAVKSKSKFTYASLNKELSSGVLRPIYVLLGSEDYLITYLRRLIYQKALSSGSETMDAVVYDLDNKYSSLNEEKLLADIATPAFVSPNKLIHLKQTSLFKRALSTETFNSWKGILERVDQGCILLFDEPQGQDERSVRLDHKLLSLINDLGGAVFRADQQSERELLNWISAQCKHYGVSISNEAALSLISRYESSMSMIQQGLNIIFLYMENQGLSRIDLALVDLLCRADLSGQIFDLTDALAAGNSDRVLAYLDRLLDRGEAALAILAAISGLARRLLIARELNSSSAIIEAGVTKSSFYAGKLIQQSRAFSAEELDNMLEACFQCDLSIKTGSMRERDALVVLLISLTRRNK